MHRQIRPPARSPTGKSRDLKRISLGAVAVCAVALVQGPAIAQDKAPAGTDDNAVVVMVDGIKITEQDLELASQEIGQQLTRLPEGEQRRVLIEFMIENQLIAAAAAKSGTPDTADFKQRMDYWRRRSLRDAYFSDKIEGAVTDEAAKAFYDKEVAGEKGEEEIQASHILVKTEEEAKEIFEKIAHDGDFAELAKQHSLDPGSKTNGGDLGYFTKGRMVPEFEKAAFALKDGEVSAPVKSQFGWHIIKLTDRRKQEPPAFDQISDRIKVHLVRQKVREMVEGLRKDAKIEYTSPQPSALQPIIPAPKQ